MKPIVIFYHCCIPTNDFTIVKEQLELLYDSGLYHAADKIVCNVFCKESNIFNEFKKYPDLVFNYQTELAPSEGLTLKLLKEYCDNNDCNVLYIHSKGTFKKTKATSCWRYYMEYFNIHLWRDTIKLLEEVDCVGVEFKKLPKKHFSGNFWWATSDYIKKCDLPEPTKFKKRLMWEYWLCNKKPKITNLHKSGVNLYSIPYTPDKYKK